MAKAKQNQSVAQPVEGEAFAVSWKVMVLQILAGFGSLILGAVCIITQWAIWDHRISYTLITGSIVFPLCGPILIVAGIWGFIRREHLVIGDNCYQSVIGNSKIIEQVPYANIAALRLIKKDKAVGSRYIGIELVDPEDSDTILNGHWRPVEFVRSKVNFDALITDRYGSPLETIRDLLREKVESVRTDDSE